MKKKKFIFKFLEVAFDGLLTYLCLIILFDFFSNMYERGLNVIGDIMQDRYFGGWSLIACCLASYLFGFSLTSLILGIRDLIRFDKRGVQNENK